MDGQEARAVDRLYGQDCAHDDVGVTGREQMDVKIES